MKKLICTLLVFLTFVTPALADEILFRDIPWGSNVPYVLDAMPQYSNECDFGWETRIDAWNSFNADYGKSKNGESPTIYYYGDLSVAGYKINSITFQFLFSVDTEGVIHRGKDDLFLRGAMYRFEVADIEMASADLTEKLTDLYGEGEQHINELDNQTITWYGDNSTGVCLEYSDDYIVIWYGNTDESVISNLDKALAREEQEKAVGNIDGL